MNSNLDKEIQNYTEISRQSEHTLSKLFQFFKTFTEDGLKVLDKSLKNLEDYFAELRKEPSSTTNNVSFLGFYNDIHRYISNLKKIYTSIDTNIIVKFEKLLKRIQNNHNVALGNLTKLSLIMNENKIKMDKYKYNYFNACKNVLDQEKRIIQLKDNKKVKEEDFSKNNELLSKYVVVLENQEGVYKQEINKLNKILETCEEVYNNNIKIFKDEYEHKLNCILSYLNYFKIDLNNLVEEYKNIIPKITKATKCINVERDLNIFSEQNNYMNENKKRFLMEKFLDYKNLRNDENGLNTTLTESLKSVKDMNKSLKIINLGKKEEIKIEFKNQVENDINEYLMSLLNDDKKLENDKYEYVSVFIKNNSDNIELVLNILLNQCKHNSFIKITNLENLYLLSDLLKSILIYASNNSNNFELCYMALFIAEKTIYFNKDNIYNKCYLCKILSNNEIFSDSKFWTNLVTKKINMLAEIKSKSVIEKREKEKIENNKNAKNGRMSKLMGMFNFSNDKNKENEIIENEILFGQIYEEKLPYYSVDVLEDYIQHFSNFNFDQKKASQLILEMAEKYKFDDSFVTYFMAKLNSNMCINQEDKNKNNYEKELKQLDYDKLYFNSSNNGTTIKYKRILDPKLRGIIYSLGYIDVKDFPTILALNKNYNKKLVKIIYKNILIKYHDMDIQKHINIWKILLNYSEIKKIYDYKKIKKELNIDDESNYYTNLEQMKNSKDIIDLDVIRTNFDTNKEKNQLRISYILKAIRYAKNNINLKYCQGMNYIAAFLLNITNNEEETFYLFLCIFDGTDYGKLFIKDLEKLKKYFYVFGRLLNVLLPELDCYLKDNKIDVSFFVSPWFITLFTNTFQNIKDKKYPKMLLRIFDLFFFSGWKSIIKIGISLLKNYENNIINLKFEELLHFLIGNILKSDFFQKENYEQLMKISINFKIKNSLISDIENEYEMKKKLAKFGPKFSTGITEDHL